jgi:hypothetical protein
MRFPAIAAVALTLAAAPPETDAGREEFLRTAQAVSARPSGGGATGSMRVTLRVGQAAADAHVQTVNIRSSLARDILHLESAFTDSYRYNIAAYLFDRLLGLGMVPVAVEREFRGKPASYTWWVEHTQTEAQRYLGRKKPPDRPAYDRQLALVRVFDYLIGNTDRNKSNLLIDKKWKIWMIDHTRAFRTRPSRPFPARADACAPASLEPVRNLDPAAVRSTLGPWLDAPQIDALLERRQTLLGACTEAQAR